MVPIHIVAPGKEHIVCLLLAAFLACFGCYELWRGWGAQKPLEIDAAQLEEGAQVSSIWVRVHGQALWGERATQSEDHGYSRHLVPVISGKADSRKSVAVFLEYHMSSGSEPHGKCRYSRI
jgi:hypothetical protein